MSTELTQSAQKTLEFQEIGQVLRAAEQARRTAIAIFMPMLIALFGLFFSLNQPSDQNAYFCLAGLTLTCMSLFTFVLCTKTITHARKRLHALQDAIGVSVYSVPSRAGVGERLLYIYILFCLLITCIHVVILRR